MKPQPSVAFYLALAAVTGAGGTAVATRWRESMELRVMLERTRSDAAELMRLRDENRQLQEQQIPPAELERLRSDHAAIPRLRAELESLRSEQ